MQLSRRHWLSLAASLAARRAHGEAAPSDASFLDAREVPVPQAGNFGKKCLVLRPARAADAPLPMLVLFHGLGETSSEALGIHAWHDRYGLAESYARLCAPPVLRTPHAPHYLSDERLREINRELADSPCPDLTLVCPFTPNPFLRDPSAPLLDRYAEYVERSVLPAARAAAPTLPGAAHCGVDGVSLGGYVALEIFLRKPALFGAVGTMQGAFSQALAEVYGRRLSEVVSKSGPRAVHVTTSTFDPFRDAARRLATRLADRRVPATFTLAEGPHDQVFLREAGTLEMLLFQARALTRG